MDMRRHVEDSAASMVRGRHWVSAPILLFLYQRRGMIKTAPSAMPMPSKDGSGVMAVSNK